MAYRRRTKASSVSGGASKIPSKKIHQIDGCVYKSASLVKFHQELSNNKFVSKFELPQIKEDKKSKYGAKKCMVNGYTFDSMMEARYYLYLLEKQSKKEISYFTMQTTYTLQESFKDPFTNKTIRAITYIADFVVTGTNGTVFVVDVKGRETPEFKIKKKMFRYKYRNVRFLCLQWSAKENHWIDIEAEKKKRKK